MRRAVRCCLAGLLRSSASHCSTRGAKGLIFGLSLGSFRAVGRHVPMPPAMEEQMPDLLPAAMAGLMPKMLPLITPLVVPRMMRYIREKL